MRSSEHNEVYDALEKVDARNKTEDAKSRGFLYTPPSPG